jgi:hypothetical protein
MFCTSRFACHLGDAESRSNAVRSVDHGIRAFASMVGDGPRRGFALTQVTGTQVDETRVLGKGF